MARSCSPTWPTSWDAASRCRLDCARPSGDAWSPRLQTRTDPRPSSEAITPIAGFARSLMLPAVDQDGATRREFLEAIGRQTARLGGLIENILAVTQLSDSSFKVDEASLPETARSVLGRMGPAAERVDMDMPADLPALRVDRRLLELVIGNLLDNALKFSPEGSHCRAGARLGRGRRARLGGGRRDRHLPRAHGSHLRPLLPGGLIVDAASRRGGSRSAPRESERRRSRRRYRCPERGRRRHPIHTPPPALRLGGRGRTGLEDNDLRSDGFE